MRRLLWCVCLFAVGCAADVETDANEMPGVLGAIDGATVEFDPSGSIIPFPNNLLLNAGSGETCCTPDSTGELLYDLFDTDGSCDVSLTEFEENNLIATLLSPDLDLLDADGNFNPNDDGVLDSLSLGIGFSATTADFLPPTASE